MLRAGSVALLLFLSAGGAFATVRTVSPTGSDPADRNSIQAAVNASAPGDTIQLGAGTFVLGGGAVFIGKPSLTVAGTAGTRLVGPGVYDDYDGTEYDGFFVGAAADGTRFENLTFEKLEYSIIVQRDVDGLSVRNCNFVADGIAVWAAGTAYGAALPDSHYDGMTLVSNTITTPQRAEADPDFFLGGFFLRGVNDLVATDNVIHGPGIDSTLVGTGYLNSAGIWIADKERTPQRAGFPDPSNRGFIARNSIDNFDMGIGSTSSGAVILENTTTACSAGIVVGTAFGNLLTTGVRIIGNNATGNYDGIELWGTQQSLLLHNDARDDSDAGISFIDGFVAPAIRSTDNEATHNTGSVRNNPGNRNGKPHNDTGVL